MLQALIAGEHNPDRLAELAKGRLRAKLPQLREALAGHFRTDHHGIMIAAMLAHIDTLEAGIADLDARIGQAMMPFTEILELVVTIPGVNKRTGEVLIAECGVDMSVFPTAGHLASWAGICPGNNASAGKQRQGKTRPGPKWLRQALTEAAKAAARTRGTYLAAHHAQIGVVAGRPRPPARPATTFSSPTTTSSVTACRSASSARTGWPVATRSSTAPPRLVRQLEQLGHHVTLEQTPTN